MPGLKTIAFMHVFSFAMPYDKVAIKIHGKPVTQAIGKKAFIAIPLMIFFNYVPVIGTLVALPAVPIRMMYRIRAKSPLEKALANARLARVLICLPSIGFLLAPVDIVGTIMKQRDHKRRISQLPPT